MKKVIDSTLFSLVHDFFKIYLPNQKKSSPHTIRAYQNALESLFDFVKTEKQIKLSEISFEMIDSRVVSEFLNKLETERGCSISTRNHRLQCIRSFYAYAARMESIAVIHQAEIMKVPVVISAKANIIGHMSEAAVKAIFEQPDATTKKGLRDRFLMVILYDTAARIQEVMDIQLRDIHLGETPTVVLHGKGGKIRNVPLMPKTMEYFRKYTDVFHQSESLYSDQYLFYAFRQGRKKRITEDNIRKLIHAYGITARKNCPEVPDNVHPHLFRHSRAMHLYQRGMPLPLISEWLGHSELETTLIYAHADTELKRKAIEKSTPSDSPLSEKLNAERFKVDDEDVLKRLYGLR